MAIIDAKWWKVRRKFRGSCGASRLVEVGYYPEDLKRSPYVRAKPRSCDPTTSRQLAARARWAYVTQAWNRVLTQEERDKWVEVVTDPDFPLLWMDEELQFRELTPHATFSGLNGRVLAAGLPLFRDAYRVGYGYPCDQVTVEQIAPARVRVTVYPNDASYSVLMVLYRGPMSPGSHATFYQGYRQPISLPSRWRILGYGPYEQASPIDFDLRVPLATGRMMMFTAGWMDYSGMTPDHYVVEKLIGA